MKSDDERLVLRMMIVDEDGNNSPTLERLMKTSQNANIINYQPYYLINKECYKELKEKYSNITIEDVEKAIETIIYCMQQNENNAIFVDIEEFLNRERENNE